MARQIQTPNGTLTTFYNRTSDLEIVSGFRLTITISNRMRAPKIHSQSDDEWEYVPVKGPKRKSAETKRFDNYTTTDDKQSDDVCRRQDFLRERIESTLTLLESVLLREKFWERYDPLFHGIESIVAYGIGSPENSIASRFQFSMLIALFRHIPCNRILCFDPAMTRPDMEVAKEYGITPSNLDESVSTTCHPKIKVLLFMPHCDRVLYEWVLRNKLNAWDITFISNNFSAYTLEHTAWERVLPFLSVLPFLIFDKDYTDTFARKSLRTKHSDKSSEIPSCAFNDIAIQVVNPSNAHEILDILHSCSEDESET